MGLQWCEHSTLLVACGCSPPHIRLQSTEAIYIKELPALRALFECYADGGGEHQGTRALGLAATH